MPKYIVRSQTIKHNQIVFLRGAEFEQPEDMTDEQFESLLAGGAVAVLEEAEPPEQSDDAEDAEDVVDATKSALKTIKENSLDASLIEGTGQNGRITKDDVDKFIAAQAEDGG